MDVWLLRSSEKLGSDVPTIYDLPSHSMGTGERVRRKGILTSTRVLSIVQRLETVAERSIGTLHSAWEYIAYVWEHAHPTNALYVSYFIFFFR